MVSLLDWRYPQSRSSESLHGAISIVLKGNVCHGNIQDLIISSETQKACEQSSDPHELANMYNVYTLKDLHVYSMMAGWRLCIRSAQCMPRQCIQGDEAIKWLVNDKIAALNTNTNT